MNAHAFKPLLSAAVLTSILSAGSIAVAQDTTKRPAAAASAASAASGKRAPTAVLMVVAVPYASDQKLGDGCWARLYDGGNYTGSQYVLVGPVEVPAMRDGLGINEKYDSVVVGPKATLTVYDNINYRDKAATLKSGSRTPDLDEKMSLFETIRSLTMTCAK